MRFQAEFFAETSFGWGPFLWLAVPSEWSYLNLLVILPHSSLSWSRPSWLSFMVVLIGVFSQQRCEWRSCYTPFSQILRSDKTSFWRITIWAYWRPGPHRCTRWLIYQTRHLPFPGTDTCRRTVEHIQTEKRIHVIFR